MCKPFTKISLRSMHSRRTGSTAHYTASARDNTQSSGHSKQSAAKHLVTLNGFIVLPHYLEKKQLVQKTRAMWHHGLPKETK